VSWAGVMAFDTRALAPASPGAIFDADFEAVTSASARSVPASPRRLPSAFGTPCLMRNVDQEKLRHAL
jgi:hypothetical protein